MANGFKEFVGVRLRCFGHLKNVAIHVPATSGSLHVRSCFKAKCLYLNARDHHQKPNQVFATQGGRIAKGPQKTPSSGSTSEVR